MIFNEQKVAVIMGSDSDFPVVSPAIRRLKQFGIPVEVRVMSAHRTPEAAAEFSKNAEKGRLWRYHCGGGQGCASCGRAGCAHDAAGHRHSVKSSTRSTALTHCLQPCRCPPAFRWRRWRLTARTMLRFWRRRCWRFPTRYRKAAAPDEGGYGAGCCEKERSLAAESCRAIIREG